MEDEKERERGEARRLKGHSTLQVSVTEKIKLGRGGKLYFPETFLLLPISLAKFVFVDENLSSSRSLSAPRPPPPLSLLPHLYSPVPDCAEPPGYDRPRRATKNHSAANERNIKHLQSDMDSGSQRFYTMGEFTSPSCRS
ncbi:unnamed protein product [Pleuronectes platessa]|uniref:Uncharacterized protein n=1 Tax=Pleuronectes platessa TaxID=8262 RepID=A0A9N7VX13_PLEPL|nr:unnamed protein product [Pleuronectes platessa]